MMIIQLNHIIITELSKAILAPDHVMYIYDYKQVTKVEKIFVINELETILHFTQ